MVVRLSLLISPLCFSLTGLAAAQTIYQIELRDHASLLSSDRPIDRGRLTLFHRYPDGAFFSIPKEEIVRVAPAVASPATRALLPGEAIDVGLTGGGHRPEMATDETGAMIPTSASGPYGPTNPGSYGYGGAPRYTGQPRMGTSAMAPQVAAPNPMMTNPSPPGGRR